MEKTLLDIQGLKGQDFAHVPYPKTLLRLVDEADTAWKAFYRLPEDVKRSFGYMPDGLLSGVGYQSPETGRDPKEHVHIRLAEAKWLRAEAKRINNEVVSEFVETALALAEHLKPFARNFVETAEHDFQLPGLAMDTMTASNNWVLRFLHYLPGSAVGSEIAAQHLDKGGFTLHLRESTGGFQHLMRDGTWVDVEFEEGETLIIAGMRLQYRAKCGLVAVCHRVVANETSAREGRDSIVCFFDFLNAPYYDKPRIGSTQQFPEGFNYAMPFEKYAELFTFG